MSLILKGTFVNNWFFPSIFQSTEMDIVVDAEWLNGELKKSGDNIRILDVTWYSDKDANSDYLK